MFRQPLVEHRALYYPATFPPLWWIKQAFLLHDSVTTIVVEKEPHRITSVGEIAARYWPRVQDRFALLQWLAGEGRYEAIHIEQPLNTPYLDFGVFTGQLASEVLSSPGRTVIPQTSLSASFEWAVGRNEGMPSHRCRKLLLDGLLPVPGEGVSMPDILDFRQRHEDELLMFRIELAKLTEEIRKSEGDPLDTLHAARQGIELAVRQMEKAATSRRLRFTAASATMLAIGSTAAATLPASTLNFAFSGFGAAALATLGSRIVRGSPDTENPYGYLVRAHEAYG